MMKLVLVALVAAHLHAAIAQEQESTCGAESVTCPAGDELDRSRDCISDCDTSTAGVQDTGPGLSGCSTNCNADRCCYTPHVIRGTALTADATTNGVQAALTDTGYLVSWEEYSDAACTLNDGKGGEFIDGLPASGLSATCISQIHGGTTPFGFYGYCPGETGKGYYEITISSGAEYTLSSFASQCPSAASAKGGAFVCDRACMRHCLEMQQI